ncbi:hypothetical protein [Flavobacterium sp. FlaQc-48]|uniref:hypothetical protein n=1 Tax=Flavobacterium sp. FlaQc-48 TaxID=3374181 RepID=UPI0037574F51
MSFFKPFKLGILIAVLSYISLNSIIIFNNYRYKKELSAFDLNSDGFFTENEISVQQKKAMERVSNDTARNFAPFLLIPVSALFGYVGYRIKRQNSK